jgi:hypothetical protein
MYNYKIIFNYSSKNISIEKTSGEQDNTGLYEACVPFTFERNNQSVNLTNFNCSIRLSGGEIDQTSSWPAGLAKPIKTDQDLLFKLFSVDVVPDIEYTVDVTVNLDGQQYQSTGTFTIPRPDKSFPSWVWSGREWEAPVDYPDDGNDYVWDEETQSWV